MKKAKRERKEELVIRLMDWIRDIEHWYKRRNILNGPRNSHSPKVDTSMLDKAKARLAEAKRGLEE